LQSGTTLSPFNAFYHDKTKNESNDGGLVQSYSNNTGITPKKVFMTIQMNIAICLGVLSNGKLLKFI
jgi:hypothetical protein